ncbi:MAG TPA: M23 family metallopeptidase [Vicinamibacterales bacterium]
MLNVAVVALAMVIALAQPAPLVQSVDLAVPGGAALFQQAGRTQLVHELHVTNFQQADITIRAVAVRDDDGTELARYEGADLARRITRPGLRNDYATPEVLGPGMRAIVHFWLTLPTVTTPSGRLIHVVDVDVTRAGVTVSAQVIGGASRITMTAVEIGPPLRGGPWVAIYDPLLKGGHRTAVYTVDGRARIPGRFAIDFIAHPQGGALPEKRAADANGFGTDVLAVADGTIAIAVDGVTDATPPPITLELAPGNHIALDLGGGRVAFYEHLQMGSVAVKAGDRVARGQVIARLGSSGSSSIGPHLHFHVADTAHTLAAEGAPFVFQQFAEIGKFASLNALLAGERWLPSGSARTHRAHRPDPVTVIHFP